MGPWTQTSHWGGRGRFFVNQSLRTDYEAKKRCVLLVLLFMLTSLCGHSFSCSIWLKGGRGHRYAVSLLFLCESECVSVLMVVPQPSICFGNSRVTLNCMSCLSYLPYGSKIDGMALHRSLLSLLHSECGNSVLVLL